MKKSLPYWNKKGNESYVGTHEELQEKLKDLNLIDFAVSCKNCKRELVKFSVEDGKKGRIDGILGLRYSQHLMAYRPREDGLLGLECVCGFSDTRLSTMEKEKYPGKFPTTILHSGENKARFNEPKSFFVAK